MSAKLIFSRLVAVGRHIEFQKIYSSRPVNCFHMGASLDSWRRSYGVSESGAALKDGESITDMSDMDWKERLTSEQYRVCRKKGTEMAFTGRYYDHHEKGMYTCVCCGADLFSSETKYDSGSGWPSFTASYRADGESEKESNVKRQADGSLGMQRVEVLCKKCGAHLGHVFNDGPAPTGERFCINSVSLAFKPKTKPNM